MTLQPLHRTEASSPLLTVQDRDRIQEALDNSVAPNTRRAYNQAWRRFAVWAENRQLPVLPAAPEVVAAFLTELAELGMAVSTLRLQKSALAAVHRAAGERDPTETEGVRKVMSGLARTVGRNQKQARPLTAEGLAAVRATATQPRRNHRSDGKQETAERALRRGQVDVALLSVMRDGLLRRSEAARLRWDEVEFQEDGTARLLIGRSKTDQEGEGAILYIGAAAAAALLQIRPNKKDQQTNDSRVFRLSESQIGRRIDAAARVAGLGDGYTGHSGRVGMAQDLAASGAQLPELMTAGRWKSSGMPARYTANQAAARGAVARYYQARGSQ